MDFKNLTLKEWQVRVMLLMRNASEEIAQLLIRSIPLVGEALVLNRKTLKRFTTLFEDDDEIQRDIDKVVNGMAEIEDVMLRLKTHLEVRNNDLQQMQSEYKRFKDLAAVEKEKAQPILNELKQEGNKGVLWGALINLLMVILGIILAHYLRIWLPQFTF